MRAQLENVNTARKRTRRRMAQGKVRNRSRAGWSRLKYDGQSGNPARFASAAGAFSWIAREGLKPGGDFRTNWGRDWRFPAHRQLHPGKAVVKLYGNLNILNFSMTSAAPVLLFPPP
jgi:hypothetical protein